MTRGERAVAIAAPVSIVLLWQLAVSTRFLNPGLFPPPSEIAANFAAYASSGELATNTAWTLGRLIVGLPDRRHSRGPWSASRWG